MRVINLMYLIEIILKYLDTNDMSVSIYAFIVYAQKYLCLQLFILCLFITIHDNTIVYDHNGCFHQVIEFLIYTWYFI